MTHFNKFRNEPFDFNKRSDTRRSEVFAPKSFGFDVRQNTAKRPRISSVLISPKNSRSSVYSSYTMSAKKTFNKT